MNDRYKCPICEELVVEYDIVSGTELVGSEVGQAVAVQGDPRQHPKVTIRCGNGCAISVKGRDRVATLMAMIRVPS